MVKPLKPTYILREKLFHLHHSVTLCMHAKSLQPCPSWFQSCLSLQPYDCSPPGSSVHGILQARILERAAVPSSRGIFPTQGSIPFLLCFLHWQLASLPLVPAGEPLSLCTKCLFLQWALYACRSSA